VLAGLDHRREPTMEEISEVTGIEPEEVESIKPPRKRRSRLRNPSATRSSPSSGS
jgi:hypothetical protein